MTPYKEMLQSVPFQYALSVLNGDIVTGRKIYLAVERFFKWIETADQDGYYLDHSAGMAPIVFARKYIRHTKGKTAGEPFVLAPFQQFNIYNVWGWKHKDTGLRRIRTVYDKRAKKNGKSAEIAMLGLFMMAFDGESSSEVYVGSTKEEQSKICWNAAASFIDHPQFGSPVLKALGFRKLQNRIIFDPLKSKMRPLGGDSKTQDGIDSHFSIIDEYHAHANDSVKENLESSAVFRSQPLTYHITTAGFELFSVCKEYEDQTCIPVLEGQKTDDSLWVMMHDLDPDDDWEDERCWVKANPLLGQGLSIENLRNEFQKAQNQLSKVPNFKTKHLNMWVDAPEVWIPAEKWKNNKVKSFPKKAFFRKTANYSALDLSTTIDITAFTIMSEPSKKGIRYSKSLFFCPLATIDHRAKEDKVPYRAWMDAGYLIATPGDTIDYQIVKSHIIKCVGEYNIGTLLYDGWNASDIVQQLQEQGLDCQKFSQGIGTISWPTKQFEKFVYDGKIRHDGNPVMEYMLAGSVIYRDANDNIKVHKGKSNRRVDGVVTNIMALGGSLAGEDVKRKSKYATGADEIWM